MSVGDEQRTGLAGSGRSEVVPVDEPHPLLDRVDPEPRPSDVEE